MSQRACLKQAQHEKRRKKKIGFRLSHKIGDTTEEPKQTKKHFTKKRETYQQ